VVIDDFLTAEALEALHTSGIESQHWHKAKMSPYIGAMSSDGFGPAAMARLANELENALPEVFDGHTLLMHWGFKYDSGRDDIGIKAHADTAAINLNFWVSDDDANLDKNSGGLVVYNRRVGDGHQAFTDYNHYDVDAAALGLTDKDIKSKVAYRQNRAVLFHSSYLHETDHHKFKTDFTKRRINYTLLFGFMESIRCSKCQKSQGEFCTGPPKMKEVPQPPAEPKTKKHPRVYLPPDVSYKTEL